jgi:hypothetical protein
VCLANSIGNLRYFILSFVPNAFPTWTEKNLPDSFRPKAKDGVLVGMEVQSRSSEDCALSFLLSVSSSMVVLINNCEFFIVQDILVENSLASISKTMIVPYLIGFFVSSSSSSPLQTGLRLPVKLE